MVQQGEQQRAPGEAGEVVVGGLVLQVQTGFSGQVAIRGHHQVRRCQAGEQSDERQLLLGPARRAVAVDVERTPGLAAGQQRHGHARPQPRVGGGFGELRPVVRLGDVLHHDGRLGGHAVSTGTPLQDLLQGFDLGHPVGGGVDEPKFAAFRDHDPGPIDFECLGGQRAQLVEQFVDRELTRSGLGQRGQRSNDLGGQHP